MNYSDYTTALATILVIPPADANFLLILPRCIEYAEQRLYRELDLVATSTRNTAYALTAGSRNLVLPIGTFVVIDNINVITPYTTSNPELGTRVALTPMSWDVLDALYGSSSASVPKYFALQDTATIAVGPWPDQSYHVEIIGTVRPPVISGSNTTTLLSTYFPELMVAASMVFMSGYTRNFGSQADDPKMALSWEAQYGVLLASAQTEEAKKRAISSPQAKSA